MTNWSTGRLRSKASGKAHTISASAQTRGVDWARPPSPFNVPELPISLSFMRHIRMRHPAIRRSGPMAKLRTQLINFAIRGLVKRRLAACRTPLDVRKAFNGTPSLAPRGVRFSPATIGGLSGEWAEPKAGANGFGALLYLHGGGYVGMSARTHRAVTGGFALRGFRVFSPDYRLAPEHIFPAALDDVAAVWRALREQVKGPIFVAGDSSGGGLAVALLLTLRDQREPAPAAACLFSPWTDFAVTGASLTVNRDRDPMQVAACLRMLSAAYVGQTDPRMPLVSPIYGDLAGLPPLVIFVGADEILLDDSKRLAERARMSGVAADLRVYPDMPHAWPLLSAIMPEGREALDEATTFLQVAALRAIKINAQASAQLVAETELAGVRSRQHS
jgi:monoterpene epsilon-lactone hydrolase